MNTRWRLARCAVAIGGAGRQSYPNNDATRRTIRVIGDFLTRKFFSGFGQAGQYALAWRVGRLGPDAAAATGARIYIIPLIETFGWRWQLSGPQTRP